MRALKIIGKILLAILILIVLLFIGAHFYFENKFPVDEDKYPHYIGYIDQEKAQLNDVYTLCDEGLIMHTHHGAAEEGYKGSKKVFRDNILSTYKNEGYTDSGYLNFRFLVTCEGNPGWFETIQVDTDYRPTKFNEAMVAQLLKLTAQPQHWNTYNYKRNPDHTHILDPEEGPKNYYMYVSYKLKNGEITEILP